MSASSPLPSRLCSISQLPTLRSSDKVRFLGCVNHYDEATATLSLFHNFPTPQDRQIAQVDISQLLDTIDRQLLQIGAWINVVGYVTPSTSTNRIQVQAVIIWSAGAINLQQYETALVSRQTT
ncbi:hypothetical protein E4T42_06869 [Aureobasidium subglaciale]|uniref:CST complex subunit Ten1 n=1 Tax=Aureobasidium subglaciale (strain EXF-2481) TaxID=1043005 RepID=A0A074YLK5_AURSE|nr:uncharacterized protein AUEXF2481DRAFT_1513 [Aureobasidium subglaciale EXF-2481]KAI5203524.1 hypothetical protein E4T38_05146 [Aureobasidium subglaciale]KAI5222074.1 hypothetical protein E4T40_05184 [Aureobasidium subglaciale]KAI5225968.1 hypothetical protein E4T41_05003 [Aureobasidium subglaciale]KAI5245081.1 hypothetical protein E4T42_06869 [Aureobasidium subglaciale]KAI5261959.1 hypothetical protein E4T46_04896 [Aureobasidium subglaciale]